VSHKVIFILFTHNVDIRISIIGPEEDLNNSFLFTFLGHRDLDPTNTTTFSKAMFLDGAQLQVNVSISEPQDGFTSLRDTHLRNSHGFVCLYNKANRQSLQNLLRDHLTHLERVKDTLRIPLVFFGNGDVPNSPKLESYTKQNIRDVLKYEPILSEGSVKDSNQVQDCMWDLIRTIVKENNAKKEYLFGEKPMDKKKKKRKCIIS
jgi:hypothetical protein